MEIRKQFRLFTVFEYEKEEAYLREMHKAGWRFTKVKGLGMYYFEKCTPQDVVYRLDYNEDGLAHKDEYVKMFDDCGWEYIQDYVGYSYFRKAVGSDGEEEEIFCDEESRLRMMERVMKGRMTPLLVIFTAVLLPQLLLNLFCMHNYFIATLYGAVLALYVAIFAVCFAKYSRYKRGVK